MSTMLRMLVVPVALLCGAGLTSADAEGAGQSAAVSQTSPATTAAAADSTGSAEPSLWPELRGPVLTWFAIFVILLLTLQSKPILTWRNLDGVILAVTCVLLAFRGDAFALPDGLTGQTLQWWAYLALAVVAAYWLLRGLQVVFARAVRVGTCNVSSGAMLMLVLAGLAVSLNQLTHAPLSGGSRDAMVGGVQMARTGKLPYGDVGAHDRHSPLLYAAHAGAIRLTCLLTPSDLGFDERAANSDPHIALSNLSWAAQTAAPRVVNGLLWLLTALALYVIGRRLHSSAIGFAIVAIFCVFPGIVECLPRPEIMLPATLMTWSLAFALLPGVGGLLSMLCLVFAGMAWPWAWLALPLFWAYFLRRGWHVVGSSVGLFAGAVACLAGLTSLTAPAIPRPDGALAAAGLSTTYAAHLTDGRTLVIDEDQASPPARATYLAPLWRFLVNAEQCVLDNVGQQSQLSNVEWPNGVDPQSVTYRLTRASGEARRALQEDYRAAIADSPEATRGWVALRTVIEATYRPDASPPVDGAWLFWAGTDPEQAGLWTLIRRLAKVAVGVMALFLAAVFLAGRPLQPHQLVGATAAVCGGTLLASDLGAVTNLAWLMPVALALLAAHGRQREQQKAAKPNQPAEPVPLPDLGPVPRITVEE